MFINCRHCNALVATDPATDQPPERCPRCGGALRTAPVAIEEAIAEAPAAGDAVAEASPADDAPATPDDGAVAPAQAIAEPESQPEPEATREPEPEATSVPASGPDPEQVIAAASAPPAREGAKSAWARAADLLAGLAGKPPAAPAAPADPVPPAVLADPAPVDAATHEAMPVADDDADQVTQASPEADAATDPVAEIDVATQHDAVAPATADVAVGREDAPAPTPSIAAEPAIATDAGATPPTEVPSPVAKPAPSFAAVRREANTQRAPRHRWLVPAAIAALCATLALQILLADRARLAADAGWRPLLSTLCGAFGCALPPWREPQALVLLSRDVRPHPSRPGVLRATATFRNDARWAQAWPQVVLVLSDVDGRAIASRAFDARDYLGAQPADAALSSGQSAMIRLDVVEPATDAVAFSFEFR